LPQDVRDLMGKELVQVTGPGHPVADPAFGIRDQRGAEHAVAAGALQRCREPVGAQRGEVRRGVGDQRPHRAQRPLLLDLGQRAVALKPWNRAGWGLPGGVGRGRARARSAGDGIEGDGGGTPPSYPQTRGPG
jgi:hypothetical protein